MNRRLIVGALIGIALGAMSQLMAQQQPTCLHGAGESAAQQGRRQQALRYTRMINSAEAAVRQQTGSFQSVTALPRVGAAPDGFVAHVAVESASYAFSVRDSTDPCGFAYFSDQDGVIYTGQPIG